LIRNRESESLKPADSSEQRRVVCESRTRSWGGGPELNAPKRRLARTLSAEGRNKSLLNLMGAGLSEMKILSKNGGGGIP